MKRADSARADRKRGGPTWLLTTMAVAAAFALWPSCKSGGGGPGDAGDEGDAVGIGDVTIDNFGTETCNNPCGPVCPCNPGDTFFNAAKCETVVCPNVANPQWGGVDCVNGLGCQTCDNPCGPICACTPGAQFLNPATCINVICPNTMTNPTWGGVDCVDGPGCDAATDTSTDAPGDAPSGDGGVDASMDASSE